MPSKEDIMEALKNVHDPELKLDIVTLGLIYDLKVDEEDKVSITMTFTSVGCPYGPALLETIKQAVLDAGAKDVEIELTFDPPWKPSEEIKWAIGGFSPWSH